MPDNPKIQRPAIDLPKGKILLKLFFSMLYISSFTFGGGFVIVTLMKKRFVDKLGWLQEDEMLDLVALAQSSPGSIAVNASILVGWRACGFSGMLTSVLGTIIPPFVILAAISFVYAAFATNKIVGFALRGMQAGVAAVILDVVFSLGAKILKKPRLVVSLLLMTLAFLAAFVFHVNVIFIIIAAAAVGAVMELVKRRRGKVQ